MFLSNNHIQNMVEKLVPDPFIKNELSTSHNQQSDCMSKLMSIKIY